jgi:hypothetical protein
MRRLILATLFLTAVATQPAFAIFDQPPAFFAPMTALTPPPLIPLAIDGTPQSSSGASTTPSVTVTTTQPNDILLLGVYSLDSTVLSVTDTAGLTWVQRATAGAGTVNGVMEWYAYAPAIVTSDVITVTFGVAILNTIIVVPVVGTAIGETFDVNASLPATTVGTGGSLPSPASTFISTTHGNDMLIEIYNSGVLVPLPPTGFTDLGSAGNLGVSYKIVAAPQAGVQITTGSGYEGGIITDSFQGE